MKKRRLLSIVLSLCMVLALMPQMVFAETTEDGQFKYTMSDGKVKINWFYGTGTTVTIPSEINDYPVTSILHNAFQFKTNLRSVTFQSPSNVTVIGAEAFRNCSNLASITLPDSVTIIGKQVFYKCRSLTSVTIPDRVTSIEKETFSGCTGLTSVTIPDSVTLIEEGAFSGCTGLTSVTIPDSVMTIGKEAFSGCTGLTSVTIPDSVTTIGKEAFSGCTGLTSIEVDGSNAAYSSEAGVLFTKDKTQLIQYPLGNTNKSYSIPDSVTSIGNYAFEGCTSLERIFLPDDLDASSANIPATTTKVRYSLDNDKATITEIELGKDKTSVAIPATICGYDVVAVAASEQSKVGAHKCNSRAVIMSKALKTAGTCKSEAVYYYSCGICGKVYSDDNTTFNGEKDSSNHTGGTEIRGAKDATCTEEGYAGDTYCKGCGTILSQGSSKNKLKHDLVKTSAKEATAAETGNKEYWQCKDCKKYFSDEDGTNEITDLESWKAGEGQIDKLPPEIIKGKGQSITAGEKKALSFTSNAAYSDFIRVELDGKTLDEKNYTVKEGSTIVTLKADYVATLSAGKHTIGIVSESGTATTTFTVSEMADAEDSVKTGDDTNLVLWLALMLLSGAGITGVTAYTRRKRTNE